MECAYDDEAAARYVGGALADPERETFEDHYFECDACLARVQALQAAAEALGAARPQRRRVTTPTWAMAAGLAAVGLGALVVLRSAGPAPPSPGPPSPAATVAAVPAWLLEMAEVEPAPYAPLVMRGEDQAPTTLRRAMEPYLRGEFGVAAAALRDLVRARPQDDVARFYLGVSELLAGETDAALDELDRVATSGRDATLAHSARYYRAKAWLRKGDLESARRELEAVAGTEGPRTLDARRVLDELASHRTPGP